jgi:hypothetical protein
MRCQHDLPKPDGTGIDGSTWWRLSSGEHVYVIGNMIYSPIGEEDSASCEWDALVRLAAVASISDRVA